jgi:hypothetical protein
MGVFSERGEAVNILTATISKNTAKDFRSIPAGSRAANSVPASVPATAPSTIRAMTQPWNSISGFRQYRRAPIKAMGTMIAKDIP